MARFLNECRCESCEDVANWNAVWVSVNGGRRLVAKRSELVACRSPSFICTSIAPASSSLADIYKRGRIIEKAGEVPIVAENVSTAPQMLDVKESC
jgi:hypothetical protein